MAEAKQAPHTATDASPPAVAAGAPAPDAKSTATTTTTKTTTAAASGQGSDSAADMSMDDVSHVIKFVALDSNPIIRGATVECVITRIACPHAMSCAHPFVLYSLTYLLWPSASLHTHALPFF